MVMQPTSFTVFSQSTEKEEEPKLKNLTFSFRPALI